MRPTLFLTDQPHHIPGELSHSREDHREFILGNLQEIGQRVCAGRYLSALKAAESAIADYPNEPVFYLRRADLLVQKPQIYRENRRLNIYTESKLMLDKLEDLQDTTPIFAMSDRDDSRERRSFRVLHHIYGNNNNWPELQERVVKISKAYFPYADDFNGFVSGPVRIDNRCSSVRTMQPRL